MPVPAVDRPLGVRADLRLSLEQAEMMRTLERYDLWFVHERLARKGLIAADRIPGAIVEFKRYMALVGLGYRGLGMSSREVDEVWHALILFTREYADFCQATFGAFIHHVPRTSRSPQADGGPQRFAQAYNEVFGEIATDGYGVVRAGAARVANEPSGCGTEDCTYG